MPPKKAAKEEKILLGRPGNNLKSGIVRCSIWALCKMLIIFQVGLANVGKSTLFQAITKCHLGNPAVREMLSSPWMLLKSSEFPFCDH
jgi:obg-like ATPase 1